MTRFHRGLKNGIAFSLAFWLVVLVVLFFGAGCTTVSVCDATLPTSEGGILCVRDRG